MSQVFKGQYGMFVANESIVSEPATNKPIAKLKPEDEKIVHTNNIDKNFVVDLVQDEESLNKVLKKSPYMYVDIR